MSVCHQCGAQAGSEKFCGVCGTRLERETAAAAFDDSLPPPPAASSEPAEADREKRHTSMAAPRGTGELVEESEAPGTSQISGPRRSKPKALEGGKVLNHRYEVVRR